MLATINAATLTVTFRADPSEPIGGSLALARARAERLADALRVHENADLFTVRCDGTSVALECDDESDAGIATFADVVTAQIGAAQLDEALNSAEMRAVVRC